MDFEYEIQMAHMNARLYNKDGNSIYDNTGYFISSSIVKEGFHLTVI